MPKHQPQKQGVSENQFLFHTDYRLNCAPKTSIKAVIPDPDLALVFGHSTFAQQTSKTLLIGFGLVLTPLAMALLKRRVYSQ